MNIIDLLAERGLIDATSHDHLRDVCARPIKLYIGFDPTADSLHLGSLVGILILKWFEQCGHTPVVVLGGATGRIGDPSGKSTERVLMEKSRLEANVQRIRAHFEQILDSPLLLNNDMWLSHYSLIEFLGEVGKHFRVNIMMTKESVRARLASEEGISFTEFSYQILQAYDFYHLFQEGVVLQCGGSDQWGNITAGIELIRKITGNTAYGMTYPLLTRSDGKKFGKTEGGAMWLAADRTSPYDLYQYLYRVSDADVIKLMRMLTLMPMEEVHHWHKAMQQPLYVPNSAQRRLAEAITHLLHGDSGLQSALRATEAVAPGHATALTPETLRQMMRELPYLELPRDQVIGHKFADIALQASLVTSKGEGARLIPQGGAYINNVRIDDPACTLEDQHLIEGEFLLLGAGKKKKALIHVI